VDQEDQTVLFVDCPRVNAKRSNVLEIKDDVTDRIFPRLIPSSKYCTAL
jgi:hypothetical protein